MFSAAGEDDPTAEKQPEVSNTSPLPLLPEKSLKKSLMKITEENEDEDDIGASKAWAGVDIENVANNNDSSNPTQSQTIDKTEERKY